IADSSASTLAFLSSMGQREAIAFGEGVATTMRLKFEKLAQQFIPGTAKGEQAEQTELGNDVDLAVVVERLRNVPKPTQSMAFAEAVDSTRQAGDPDYKKPAAATRAQPDDDFDTRYGLKP
ncbi:ATPase, partial [Mesorhizobium sp. M2D.F.Ca.ET.223.01.1.1]